MSGMDSVMERFDEILAALDALAEDYEGPGAEDLEDLNAELEDALMLLDELRPGDGEELVDALEDIRALAGDYRGLSGNSPELAELAGQLDMAAGMAMGSAE